MKSIVSTTAILAVLLVVHPAFAQESETAGPFTERSKFLLAGFGFVNAVNQENEASSFQSGFNPIFLWQPNKMLFFESELEFAAEDGGTEVALEYAQLFYTANSYVTFGAGKFLNPSNIFMERLHPAWINKFPDAPFGLGEHGGVQISAGTQLGAQARGAMGLGRMKLTYVAYVSNGPSVVTEEADSSGAEEEHGPGVGAGNFDNTNDNNGDKAFGGRIAILPVPALEIGYGFESSAVGDENTEFEDVRSLNNVVDLNYVNDVRFLRGRVDIRGQVVWFRIDNPNQGLLNFDNSSVAGYGQVAYRPTGGKTFIQNFEVAARYDFEDLPSQAPENVDLERISVGLNYWISPAGVLKMAVQNVKRKELLGDENDYRIIGQFAMGF